MKRQIAWPALLLALIIVGCATFESNAFKVIGTTTRTVEAARASWVDYVTKQRVLLATNPAELQKLEINVAKVGVLYGQYQTAMDAAEKAVISFKTGTGTEDAVTIALNALAAAAAPIISLIQQITGH